MSEDTLTTPTVEVEGRKIVFSASVRKEVADEFREKVREEGRKVSWVIDQLMELYLKGETPLNI